MGAVAREVSRDLEADLLEARPDVVTAMEKDKAKGEIATVLRSLRRARGLTQRELQKLSGLDQAVISRMEAPTGSFPAVETLHRYVSACGGTLTMRFCLEDSSDGERLGEMTTQIAPGLKLATDEVC